MRHLSSIVRVALTAASLIAACLIVASVTDAAPVRARLERSRRMVCDPRLPARRELARRAFGPAAAPMVLHDVAARMRRASARSLSDDDEAIQTGASAVGLHADEQLALSLEPLGLIISSHSPLLGQRTYSRRSPRGPTIFG